MKKLLTLKYDILNMVICMNKNIFREYDIRGKYPEDINEEFALFFGQKYGTYLKRKGYTNVAIGRDIRLSSEPLQKSIIEGLLKSGIDVIDLGVCSTPMVGCASIILDTATIEVTASHNPSNENGIKFFLKNNYAFCGDELRDFYNFMDNDDVETGEGNLTEQSILEDYKKLLFNKISFGNRKLKIVVDPGNGVTAVYVKELFKDLPFDITYICDEPDGRFPNHHPDPAVLENNKMLMDKVKEIGADFGAGYDGDGDRFGLVDNEGNFIYPDIVMSLLWKLLVYTDIEKRTLFDVKCSPALPEVLKNLDVDYIVYKTGAPLLKNEINRNKILFGGEYSGHMVFNDKYVGVDDGVYCTIRLLEMLSKTNHSITEILSGTPQYVNNGEMKLPTPDEIKFEVVAKVLEHYKEKGMNIVDIDGVRVEADDYEFCFRASNTGPNITFIANAKTKEKLDEIINEVNELYEGIKKEYQ